MPPLNLGEVKITHPLAHAVVTVRLSITGRVRLWLTKQLLWLAVWVSGGELRIQE